MGTSIRFNKCFKYSFVGFFFCAITPSATGGQPAQVVWMARDGIDAGLSSLVLCIVTMVYKIALLVISGVLVLLNLPFVQGTYRLYGLYLYLQFPIELDFYYCARPTHLQTGHCGENYDKMYEITFQN